MKKMSQRTRWITITLVLAAVLGWSIYNTIDKTQPAEEIKTSKARQGDIVLSVNGVGTLDMVTLPIGFEVNGVISSILPSGSIVKQGDVIATIENDVEILDQMQASLTLTTLTSPSAEAALTLEQMYLEEDQAIALDRYNFATDGPDVVYYAEAVTAAEKDYYDAVSLLRSFRRVSPAMRAKVQKAYDAWEAAKLDLEWAMTFVPNDTQVLLSSADLSQTETAINDVDIATALIQGVIDPTDQDGSFVGTGDLADAWYDLSISDIKLDRTQITAPFDGVLENVGLTVGEKVIAYQSIAKLLDTDIVVVNFTIEEADLFGLNIGDPITVHLTAYPSVSFSGVVSRIGGNVDELGMVEISGSVEIPEGYTIFSGMTIDAEVETNRADNALLINSAAIFTDADGKHYVNKVDLLGGTEKVLVTTGISDLANTQIISGLEPGDLVSLEETQE